MSKLVEVEDLKLHFKLGRRLCVKAVDGISFYVKKGETFGIVGESGCGKTTMGKTILRLLEPTGGKIFYDGEDITNVNMQKYRKKMQIVFQDPYASLNPRMTIANIVGEPIDIHNLAATPQDRKDKINEILQHVGLNSEQANRFPHEFSGGQRQRIGIARMLAISPEFVVCDEPVSALDVSIQAQIINLLHQFQEEFGLTYLFIAHDLSIVRYMSNRIGVMYLGKLVEVAESDELVFHGVHPYTKSLISAIPIPDPKAKNCGEKVILSGDFPSLLNLPSGCRLRTRCPCARELCEDSEPILQEISPGHLVACHNCQ